MKAKGTLQQNGSYWNVIVPGVEDKQVRLEWPSVDLTPYKDQNVLVEGWFAGNTISSTGMKYVKIVLRDIAIAEGNDSSTEDVIPGDDIQFIETKALLKLKK